MTAGARNSVGWRHQLFALVFAFVCTTSGAFSSTGPPSELPTFTDPAEAGPDFQVQGEYSGNVGSDFPIGVQVIALGNHEFQGVVYTGGLPGAGWDESTVSHIGGKTQEDGRTVLHGIHGERLKFASSNFRGSIRDGAFTGEAHTFHGRADSVAFLLKKVLRESPTLGAKPPAGALVLFDGSGVGGWKDGRLVEDGLLDVGTTSKRRFGTVRIHLEFRCPFMPKAQGMKRGNSGVYVKREWEVQIVDSFGWHHENRKFERLSKFGRAGGIHEMVGPRINMSFPPLSWQTYDIEFTLARFDPAGKKISPATMTVRHNGVLIHDRVVLPPLPPESDGLKFKEGEPGPIYLQDHGNPVRYRNIWVVEKD